MEELKKYINKKEYTLHDNNINNIKAAFIIEPRKHELLLDIIANVMSYLGNEWNLYIITTTENTEYIHSRYPNASLRYINRDNLAVNDYNQLLQSKMFWDLFYEEHLLCFQTDSFILNNSVDINDFIEYPYIGGYYYYYTNPTYVSESNNKSIVGFIVVTDEKYPIHLHNSPRYNFSINGGFSLRRRSKMLECISSVSVKDIIKYRKENVMNTSYFETDNYISEDVFFQNALDFLGYDLPSKKTCGMFCENLSDTTFNEKSLGIHNFKENRIINYYSELRNCFIQFG